MRRVIVIQPETTQIRAVVATLEDGRLQVLDAVNVPIEGGDLTGAERKFAAAIESHQPQRSTVVITVPANAVKWNNLSLPPCPPEDLPSLVRLQLDLEATRDDEQIGYDFLPLAGDETQAQRVLAMVLKIGDLARIRNFYRVAGLKVDHLVPDVLGWPAIAASVDHRTEAPRTYVALQGNAATLWVAEGDRLAVVRQFQVSETENIEKLASSIAGQVRRTILNLGREDLSTAELKVVSATGDGQLAEALQGQMANPVSVLSIPSDLRHADSEHVDYSELVPLLGIAWQTLQGEKPAIDFLNPRKAPVKASNRRTMVLAACAGGLLLAAVGWQGYANLKQPLWTTEALQDELSTINKEIEPMRAEERDAARIRDWLAASPNLLTELAAVSADWRPEEFDSKEFKLENDGVLKRLNLVNRRLVLTGNVASSSAVQPLENRLRDNGHRVRRERSDPATDGGQYPWEVQIVVDAVDATEAQP